MEKAKLYKKWVHEDDTKESNREPPLRKESSKKGKGKQKVKTDTKMKALQYAMGNVSVGEEAEGMIDIL